MCEGDGCDACGGSGEVRVRAARWPRPEVTAAFCPDPDNCVHTTYVDGESCECCGAVNEAEPEPEPQPLGTITEVAERYGVDVAAAWEMVSRGQLRATRPDSGGPWLIWAA